MSVAVSGGEVPAVPPWLRAVSLSEGGSSQYVPLSLLALAAAGGTSLRVSSPRSPAPQRMFGAARNIATVALLATAAAQASADAHKPRPLVGQGEACKLVTYASSSNRAKCVGGCTVANSTCELVDPTDPSTGCMCKTGPPPLPPVRRQKRPRLALLS